LLDIGTFTFIYLQRQQRQIKFNLMDNFQKTFDVLQSTGLNWSVEKKPLVSEDGLPTESYGIFRNDNNAWLGTAGERYTPYQNSQLVERMVELTDVAGIPITNGGSLQGGKKIYLQAELEQERVGASNIKRFITAMNSHDGSTSIAFGVANKVLVCSNGFYRTLKEMKSKHRHTRNAESSISVSISQLQDAIREEFNLIQTYKAFDATTLTDEAIDRTIRAMFKVSLDAPEDSVSTRKSNQVQSFADSLVTEVNTHGKTLWSLFNAVTRYTNHVAAPRDVDAKNTYLMVGGGYKLSNIGYNEVLKMVDTNTLQEFINVDSF
jgi:phage/plasmid-like protein (TIGR03299 family)